MSPVTPGIQSAPSEIFAEEYVGRRVAKSAAWMVMLRIAFRVIGLASSLVLVRVLAPEAFGLIGIASVAYNVLDALTEFSFVLALIRLQEPTRAHFDTAWTLVVMRGFLIGGLMVASAPLVADFMRDPRLVDIIRVLALSPILQSFENVGLIQFKRDLRFDRIFWYQLLDKVVGTLLVIPAALILHNAWALVIGTFFGKFITIPVSYLIHPYRPRFSLKAAGELMNFSKWLFANNMLDLLNSYMLTFLIGRVGGVKSVGLYNVAWQLASLPPSEIAAPIRPPMYAGLAKAVGDPERMSRQFLDGLALMMMLITPMSIGIVLCADLIVPVGLGAQWTGAVPLVRVIALYTLFEAFGEFTHNVYIINDRQRRFVLVMAVLIAIRLAAVIWAGIDYGVVAAVTVLAVTGFLNSAVWFAQLHGIIGLSLRRTAKATWRIAAATMVMGAGLHYWQQVWPQGDQMAIMVAQLVLDGVIGAMLYLATLLGLWLLSGRPTGPEDHAVRMIEAIPARVGALFRAGGAVSPTAE